MGKKEDDAKKKEEEEARKKKAAEEDTQPMTKGEAKQIILAVQQLHKNMQTLQGGFETRVKALEDGSAKPDPKKEPEKRTPKKGADLERMDRQELVSHILEEVGGMLKENIQGLEERLGTTDEEVQRDRARNQIKEAAEKHPDFYDWKDQIQTILRDHPDLNIEDAYTLARSKDSDRAAAIDKKLEERRQEEAKKDEPKKEETRFGGLFATSGSAERNEKMSPEAAAEAAWEESGMDEHLAALSQ